MTLKQMGILWTLALVWGASFLFIKLGVATIPPVTFVTFRLAIAAGLIYAVMRWQGLRMPADRKLWRALVFVGFINAALPYTLFAWGEQQMGANASGLASIYNATTPLWTVAFAQLFVREERLTPLRTLGVVIGFSGVVYLFAGALGAIGTTDTLGQLTCFLAASCYGVGTLYVRRVFKGLPALVPAFGQMFAGAILLAPLALIVDHNAWQVPSASSLVGLLGLAVLGTGIAQILYFSLVKQVGATRTSQVTYLLPLFALFWGWLFLDEPLRPDMLIGLAIVLVGVVAVNGKWPVRAAKTDQPADPTLPAPGAPGRR
ncbi:MAG TPA: EamA family transporter [Herpetosiphonaceae bacterium]